MTYFAKSQVVHGSSQPLKTFLETQLQPWRWAIMLENGGIRAQRGGKPIAPLTLETTLAEGDVVFIDDAYGVTWMQLRRKASTDFRDLVFCPQRETDSFLNNQVNALIADPTAVDVPLTIKFLYDLVTHLTPLGTYPIRHLILVSHASPFGDILMPVRSTRDEKDMLGDALNWESLKEAIANAALRLDGRAPNPTLLPRPENDKGERVPCALIIRGCSSGVHTILLKKIQEAFGNLVDTVVMPKYFDSADFIGKVSATVYAASVEYFMHRFIVTSKTTLTRQGVIDAFKAAKIADWLGNPVPDADWIDLVPADVTRSSATKTLTMRIDGRSQAATFRARFDTTPLEPMTLFMEKSAKPTAAEIKDFLMKSWGALPSFQDTEWPFWKRMGLPTLDAFADYWTFEVNPHIKPTSNRWPVRGIRYAWEIRTPLVDSGTLICHYQPKGEQGTPSNNIDYNDDRIFGRFKHIPAHFAQTL